MKKMKFALLLTALLTSLALSESDLPKPGTSLTVYNDNFAVVKQERIINFNHGTNTLKFTDVPTQIDPTTVKFKALSAPGKINILEQNYEYDLVGKETLLKRYIGKEVIISIKGSGSDPTRKVEGTLAAYLGGSLIIQQGDQMEIISDSAIEYITLAQSPEDLVTKPTLVWLVDSSVQGSQLAQVTYTTEGMKWNADYTAILGPNDTTIDLSGWVTITNNSGGSYENAMIKLMAGDVRRITEPERPERMYKTMEMARDVAAGAPFQEKAFAEYHLYTLNRRTTINNNQIKQIELISPVSDIPAVKKFIFDRSQNANKVLVKLEFENREEYGLGIPLPKGKVRVFKQDQADNTLEFIGEDRIDHTAKKEELSLYIGNAFDIVPEYKQLESEVGPRRGDYRWRKEKHQVELRNRKDEPVTVYVQHDFPGWPNWEIVESTHQYEKIDSDTVRFEVNIKADSTETLVYSTVQSW